MVPSALNKVLALAISLLVMVISLTAVAMAAAPPPAVTAVIPPPYTSALVNGFRDTPGKIAIALDNSEIYVCDFRGQRIVVFDGKGLVKGAINTSGRPQAVAVMTNGNLVVAMRAPSAKVEIYGRDGTSRGVLNGTFQSPSGVAVDRLNNIYVLDAGILSGAITTVIDPVLGETNYATDSRACVQVFNSIGQPITTGVAAPGYPANSFSKTSRLDFPSSKPLGEILSPEGITYEKDQRQIVIADTMNGRIQFFHAADSLTGTPYTFSGKSIGQLGNSSLDYTSTNKLSTPHGVSFEYTSTGAVYRMYVVDLARSAVKVFDPNTGTKILTIDASSLGYALSYPTEVVLMQCSGPGLLVSTGPLAQTPPHVKVIGLDGGVGVCGEVPYLRVNEATVPPNVCQAGSSYMLNITGDVEPAGAQPGQNPVVTVTVNGATTYDAVESSGSPYWSWTAAVPITQEVNTIKVRATHPLKLSANEQVYTVYFLNNRPTGCDNPPNVTITNLNSQYVNSLTLTLSGQISQAPGMPNPFVDPTVMVHNATTSQTVKAAYTAVNATSGTWTATIPLTEGDNLVHADGYAKLSQTSSLVSTNPTPVIADVTMPNLVVTALANQKSTPSAIQNISGTVSDVHLDKLLINGQPAWVTADGYFSFPLALLNNGSNSVVIEAVDLAGNRKSDTRDMQLTPNVTDIAVTTPADNAFIPVGEVTVAGVAVPLSTFRVDNIVESIVDPADGSFTTSVPVRGGAQPIYLDMLYTDGTGITHPSSRTRSVYAITSSAPAISITKPVQDQAVNSSMLVSGNLRFEGKVPNTVTSVMVSVNNGTATAANLSAGDFWFDLPLGAVAEPGPNDPDPRFALAINAISASGSTVALRNIIYDRRPPKLTLAPGFPYLEGHVEPGAQVVLERNYGSVQTPNWLPVTDRAVTIGAGTNPVWSVDITGLAELNKHRIKATDPAQNTSIQNWRAAPTGDIDPIGGDGQVKVGDVNACLRDVNLAQGLKNPALLVEGDMYPRLNCKAEPDGKLEIADCMAILDKAFNKPCP